MTRKRKTPARAERTDRGNNTGLPPTLTEIRQRAYEIYIARGDAPGDALSDWLEAECELCAQRAAPAIAAPGLDEAGPVLDDYQARLTSPVPIRFSPCPASNALRRLGNVAVDVAIASPI